MSASSKSPNRIRRWRRAACLLAIGCIPAVGAEDSVVERWPVPMRVDREDVTTSMVVELRSQLIGAPFVNYSPDGDPDREAMAGFVQALVDRDIDEAIDAVIAIPGVSPEDNRALLEAFSMMFSESPDALLLDRIVHMGDDRLLVWSVPVEDGSEFVGSLRFQRDADGDLRYEGIQSDPLTSLITHTFEVSRESGPDDRGPEAFAYDYVLPPTDSDPVRFRFNGVVTEVDAFNPMGPTGHGPVDFFNTAKGVLSVGSPFEYAQLYTDFSAGRFIDWAEEQGSDSYEAYRAEVLAFGARVVFMLDADPLYLIFYLPTDTGIEGDPLRYTPVYRHPRGGFQLTNFYIFGFADMLLQTRQYFEEPFLRPLLREEGIITTNPGAIRATVPGRGMELPDPDDIIVPEPEEETRDDLPPPEDIDELLREGSLWPWIVSALVFLALIVLALFIRQKRGGARS